MLKSIVNDCVVVWKCVKFLTVNSMLLHLIGLQKACMQSETLVSEWKQTSAELQRKVELSQAESMQLKSQFESAVKLKEKKLQDREAHLKNINDQVFLYACHTVASSIVQYY